MIRRTASVRLFSVFSPVRFSVRYSNRSKQLSKMTDTKEETLLFAPKTYQYDKFSLDIPQIEKDPIKQFKKWYDQASQEEDIPECLTLSTASLPSGRVSSRVVLLKELDLTGFIIFSNWDKSKKSLDIASNKHVALNFFWKKSQRQVRVEGIAEFTSRKINEDYYKTRPRGSKIGAWSSPQSQVIEDRTALEKLVDGNAKKFEGKADDEIPCPDYWGGIRVVPLEVEFWQGRPSRLHDRLTFKRDDIKDDFELFRLAP